MVDPIFAALEQHRAAYAALIVALETDSFDGNALALANDVEARALNVLAATPAATREGIVAVVRYTAQQRATREVIGPEWEHRLADSLAAAIAAVP